MAFAVLIVLALSQVVMMIYYWYFNRQIKEIGDLTKPSSTQGFGEAQWGILHRAITKSGEIIGQAELEGVKSLASARLVRDRMLSESQKALLSETAKATEEYKKFLEDLKEKSLLQFKDLHSSVNEASDSLVMDFRESLSEGIMEIQKRTIVQAEAEISEMRSSLRAYQEARMKAIDEQGAEIVNRAIKLVLRGLPVSVEVEIVEQAIGRAKEENFTEQYD